MLIAQTFFVIGLHSTIGVSLMAKNLSYKLAT